MNFICNFSHCAASSKNSKGRFFHENESSTRSLFQRDRDRIIHSTAFRRLKYKTQVFVYHEGDHYRTRLTHSLEVSQMARSVARYFQLNEDLAETIALSHDLGHPPFGHAGEGALNKKMKPFGGFNHNDQTFRLITMLEKKYAKFDGLNLTWETLEGIAKHNGPIKKMTEKKRSIFHSIVDLNKKFNLALNSFPSIEAQITPLTDDIAYNNHDIDDGLRSKLFSMNDLRQTSLGNKVIKEIDKKFPKLESDRRNHEVIRRMINIMIDDLIYEIERRLKKDSPKQPNDIRNLNHPIVSFSEKMQKQNLELKSFLSKYFYKHDKVNEMSEKGRRVVEDLFDFFTQQPTKLPFNWKESRIEKLPRLITDYIAGMTDRYALQQHKTFCE